MIASLAIVGSVAALAVLLVTKDSGDQSHLRFLA